MPPPFAPARCPNATCPRHRPPRPASGAGVPFFRYNWAYAGAAGRRVRRAQCRTCGRHFSEQTFRSDYRAHRPELDALIGTLLTRGLSARAVGRLLGVSRGTVARRHARATAS